ncbi:MAG: UbiA family prenyltransferase [Epsilonproteobacteria bacterium]|nr:UbiA family prenyltransferase [Campylobacterota bacterium]
MQYLLKMAKLVKFEHTIFSMPFIFVAMLVASHGWFGMRLFVLVVLAAVFARNFAMGVNRYLDRDIDIKNERTKDRVSVNGEVSPWQMQIFILLNALGFWVVTYFINQAVFVLAPFILLVLGGYSYFKRFSEYAHIVLGVSLGLAPIGGVLSVLGIVPAWSVFLAFGVVFWVSGFDILYSLQDMEFDKKEGLFSIPSRYGVNASLFLSGLFHILAVIFWFLFIVYTHLSLSAYIGWLVCAAFLYYEQKLVREDFRNIPRAFFDLNGYLGIIFLVGVIFALW